MPILPHSLTPKDQRITIAFSTLGCKLNFSETATIARGFNVNRYIRVDFNQKADIYLINTCSVTENADKKLGSLVRKSTTLNPNAKIIVTGCYAQLQPEKVAQVKGVDLVVGAEKKFHIQDLLENLSNDDSPRIYPCDIQQINTFKKSHSIAERTRAFLKIQDGCDYKCSFCTIPKARGRSRSDTIFNIVDSIHYLTQKQIKEIVLTGVNIGDYGYINPNHRKREYRFLDLLNEINGLNNCPRIRISSIEPNLLDDQIIELVAKNNRFVPHFHIPLQSGSDKVLKIMRRRYNTSLFERRIEKIKSLNPDACIGVDVIVGFYGETETEFQKTVDFLTKLNISYLHIFTYSERPNTSALNMDLSSVPLAVRRQRRRILNELSNQKRLDFYKSQFNKPLKVLFENKNNKGYSSGYTENYLKVRTPWDPKLSNQMLTCWPNRIDGQGYVRAIF